MYDNRREMHIFLKRGNLGRLQNLDHPFSDSLEIFELDNLSSNLHVY
jgi:hypothetical protein